MVVKTKSNGAKDVKNQQTPLQSKLLKELDILKIAISEAFPGKKLEMLDVNEVVKEKQVYVKVNTRCYAEMWARANVLAATPEIKCKSAREFFSLLWVQFFTLRPWERELREKEKRGDYSGCLHFFKIAPSLDIGRIDESGKRPRATGSGSRGGGGLTGRVVPVDILLQDVVFPDGRPVTAKKLRKMISDLVKEFNGYQPSEIKGMRKYLKSVTDLDGVKKKEWSTGFNSLSDASVAFSFINWVTTELYPNNQEIQPITKYDKRVASRK